MLVRALLALACVYRASSTPRSSGSQHYCCSNIDLGLLHVFTRDGRVGSDRSLHQTVDGSSLLPKLIAGRYNGCADHTAQPIQACIHLKPPHRAIITTPQDGSCPTPSLLPPACLHHQPRGHRPPLMLIPTLPLPPPHPLGPTPTPTITSIQQSHRHRREEWTAPPRQPPRARHLPLAL